MRTRPPVSARGARSGVQPVTFNNDATMNGSLTMPRSLTTLMTACHFQGNTRRTALFDGSCATEQRSNRSRVAGNYLAGAAGAAAAGGGAAGAAAGAGGAVGD